MAAMVPLRRVVLLTALKLFDLFALSGCFVAAALVARPLPGVRDVEQLLALHVQVRDVVIMAALLAAWHLLLTAFGVYRSKRLTSRRQEVAGILRAVAAVGVATWIVGVSSGTAVDQRRFLPVFLAGSAAVVVASRIALRWVLAAARRRGRNLRYVLVVGTNRRALAFARKLETTPELGYQLVGFVDADGWDPVGEFARSGYRLVATLADLPEVLRREVLDEVFVFLPLKSHYEQEAMIVSRCEEQGIRVTFPSGLFDLRNGRAAPDEVDADAFVTIATGAIDPVAAAVKRGLDVVVSSTLLLALAPVLAATAIAVKATSPGPVLFSQERIGLNKRRFRMWKFRTMVADAERRQKEVERLNEADGPVFKCRHDPRITRVGALLRRTSIDELPQLLNVLRGDLSLVGPRPLPVRDYEGFDRDWHRRRFSVRPGITCLWQIGGRSDVPFERWMELDMQYIDKWSLWLDLKILVKTIPVVLRGTGAA
jgi:exopolysaccharide biosynthesis polyprenyl glycosylphosphotransferase